jgi:hypothetical protein
MKRILMKVFGLIILATMGFSAQSQFISNNGIQLTNTAVVSTNGDWQNSSETVILNNGSIKTTDAFVNDGVLDAASTGGFELNYTSTYAFKPGATVVGYLNKSGIGTANLTGNISIKDSLTLDAGSINILSPSDTITLLDGALVKAQTNAFVEGKVSHVGTGNKLFPIGTSGQSWSLKLYKANVVKATASLISKPVGASPGPGLDSLSGLTVAWQVDEEEAADTASYVELSFPAGLATVKDVSAVVALYNAGTNSFSSMGARAKEMVGATSRVVSYSRGLKGIYTVAYGIPVDRVQDSLALREFYFSTAGDDWTTKTGWITGPVETWQGLQFAGQAIVGINLASNNLVGAVPEQLVDLGALTTINLHDNELTSIPDFSVNSEIESLDVSVNRLTFESLEPNAAVPGLIYTGQTLGDPLDDLIEVGTPFHLEFEVGGVNTTYVWKRNGEVVEGNNTFAVDVGSINRSNMGAYVLEATNTLFPGYTLASEIQSVLAYANVSGNFTVNEAGAESGSIRILRVTSLGAYEPTDTVSFNPDGSFTFEKVVLDDYQLVGFADTLVYEDVLPTYFGNTLYWEEAEEIAVEDHISGLAIASQTKPGPTTGPGVISGYLEEEVEEEGRVKVPKRVGGAGASVRRSEGSGRGKEEELVLVGYTFTDEDGNFAFRGLPNGEYLINLQYPGYPMDESSDLRLNIEDALRSEVMVGARVIDNKINVQKITITNIYEIRDYNIQLFPNPAVEYIKVKFAKKSSARTMQLTSATGQNLMNFPANDLESVLDIKGVKPGIYLFQVQENGHVVKTVKVSIE